MPRLLHETGHFFRRVPARSRHLPLQDISDLRGRHLAPMREASDIREKEDGLDVYHESGRPVGNSDASELLELACRIDMGKRNAAR